MNRVDRYILGLFWSSFIAGLLIFVTLFMATDIMSMLVRHSDAATGSLIRYYSFLLPEIMHKMLPVACVVGTVMTISSLNKGAELIAMFAAGLSLMKISRYIFISVLLISGLSYLFADRLLPTFTKQKNFVLYNDIEKNPSKYQTIKKDRIWYRSKNTLFNIKTLSPDGDLAQGLTLYFFDENWKLIQLLTAKSVELKGATWILRDGAISVFNAESSFPMNEKFDEKTIVMTEDANDLRNTGQTSDLLTQSELAQYIEKNKEAGLDTTAYEVEYYTKLAFSFAGLVMSFLALPFCVGQARSGGMVKNIGVCLGLVMAYWILYSSLQTIGNHGGVPPLIAAWMPNVLMTSFGTFFLLRAKR